MSIRQIATYQVTAAGVARVKSAIEEFVRYVAAHEPGTRLYMAWQERDDPTRFAHFFIFDDEAAQTTHGESDAVKRFEAAYGPELVGERVVFTDYTTVSEQIAIAGPSDRR